MSFWLFILQGLDGRSGDHELRTLFPYKGVHLHESLLLAQGYLRCTSRV